MTKVYTAVNWNKQEDQYSLELWNQNTQQFWLEKEIPVSDDKNDWNDLSTEQKSVYQKVLAGLTLLDTRQGGNGMPLMVLHAPNDQQRAVFAFMGAMEEVHAKSYSHIFQTLLSGNQIDEVYDWVHSNPEAQKKADIIIGYYDTIFKKEVTARELYMAMVASVLLESFLFYSGFFYPLYLAGQGKMTSSGEIISLILRDEAIHGAFTGVIAQELFVSIPEKEQGAVLEEVDMLVRHLYLNEVKYTTDIYEEIGMTEEVLTYVRYNANRALANLALEPIFEEEDINPIVMNGIKTDTINHDFFSTKGNGYVKALNVVQLSDADFNFAGRI
jgi:ribonucleoside-diphosphate reductase beta chain